MKKTAVPNPPVINLPERIEQLSAKRQEVIRPILEHPREYVLLSVRAIAKRLRTDPATIVRIVQGLGFSSYREFQHHLHELSLAFATSLDTMQVAGRDSNMPEYVRDALGQDHTSHSRGHPTRFGPGHLPPPWVAPNRRRCSASARARRLLRWYRG